MTTFDDEVTLAFVRNQVPKSIRVKRWGAATSIGHVRKENEDRWGNAGENRFAVADGMGGTSGGLLAANATIEAFLEVDPDPGWVPQLIELNRIVNERCRSNGFTSAGSTLVGLVVEPYRCVTVHIGDSRIYRLRREVVQLLTVDHNLRSLRLEEGRDPEVKDEQGTPRALTSWIGSLEDPERIDVGTLSVQDGDRLLLVSDGVSEQLSLSEITAVLIEEGDSQVAAERLVDHADSVGGRDNSTALVVDFEVMTN